MTIAELFIKIGLAGGSKVGDELKKTKKGLSAVEDSALLAKAAILGVIYGLEKLTGFASQVGMDLNKFQQSTGLSAEALQKWQYALGRFDVDGKEVEQTVRGVQAAMTDMLLGKGAPEGMGVLAEKVGFDPARARDTFYVMSKLQQFAKTVPPDVAAHMLKGFNISPNMLQGLKMMNLEVDKLQNKDMITQKEIKKLTEINKAWKDFWFSLKTMGIKLVASEGMGILYNFFDAFKLIVEGGRYVLALMEKFTLLKWVVIGVGAAIALAFAPITTIITGVILLLGQIQKYREGKENVFSSINQGVSGFFEGRANKAKEGGKEVGTFEKAASSAWSMLGGGKNIFGSGEYIGPIPPKAVGPGGAGGAQNITQTNTFHIDGSDSPKETAAEVQKQINRAARQLGSQAEAK